MVVAFVLHVKELNKGREMVFVGMEVAHVHGLVDVKDVAGRHLIAFEDRFAAYGQVILIGRMKYELRDFFTIVKPHVSQVKMIHSQCP